MRKITLSILACLLSVWVLTACASKATVTEQMTSSAGEMMDSPMETATEAPAESEMMETAPDGADMSMHTTPTSSSGMEQSDSESMMAAPEWFAAELTNVNTGETFSLNDFQGKVILVETMAQWCSNCLKQQTQVKALHALLGDGSDLVSIALDIDPNEDEATLQAYALDHEFDWIYAVAPADVSRQIGNLYTAQFLNPPSTPILIVDRSGEAHILPFGIKSAEDLQQAIEPFLSEGM